MAPPRTIDSHETASERTSLSNEPDAHNPQPEHPCEEARKILGDTTTLPVDGVQAPPELTQQSRPTEDVKIGSPPDDTQPPTDETQSDGGEPHDSAETAKREKEAFLKFFHRVYDETYRIPIKTLSGAHDFIVSQEAHVDLESRTKRMPFLSFALQSYVRLMEERVAALEDQKRGRPFGDEDVESRDSLYPDKDLKEFGPEEEKAPKTIPTVNRVAWPVFKRKYDGKIDVDEDHAIDVLVGGAVIPYDVWREYSALIRPEHLVDRVRRLKAYEAWMSIALQGGLSKQPQQDQPSTSGQKEPTTSAKPAEMTEDSYPPVPERIRINGEPLKLLLQRALNVDFNSSGSPVVLLRPFKLLAIHRARIWKLYERLKQKFANSEREVPELNKAEDEEGDSIQKYGTEQAYKELQCLIEFMEKDLRVFKKLEDASIKKIAFSELWHIFQPGVEVITAKRPISAYRVFHVTGGRPYLSPPVEKDVAGNEDFSKTYRPPDTWSDFVVNCYQVDFDGYGFGPVIHAFNIQKFDGLKDITALPIYPIRFSDDHSKVRETLLRSGKMFLDVCVGKHVLYRGPNLHETEEIDSEIVVDFHAALWDRNDKENENWQFSINFGIVRPALANNAEVFMVSSGGCQQADCCENDHVFDDLKLDHQLMENFLADKPWLTMSIRYFDDNSDRIPKEDLMLFPHRLFAFVLKDRKWAVVDVNNVTKVPEPTKETWQSLVLPRGHKNMVYSLVQSHFRDSQQSGDDNEIQADLVRGKGKGLIILLHGAPGVGKTSTAECVAELCKRPLYPITCGDLGITPVDVETKLKRIFVQAQKWKCVLLLDEADVFLSERGTNVKHNSLVSVFLRVLEYYQGILFLTTNRVGRMDEAFRSRVHISLYYPPLDRKSTIEIFKSNLNRTAQRKKGMMKIRENDILDFAEDHYDNNDQRVRWNGRQIRNAFHIAVALAENDAVEQDAAAKAKTTSDEARGPRKPKLRASHFQVVEDASSKFDEYLTSVLGMAQSERIRQEAYRKDDWKLGEDRQGQKRHPNRRRRKIYSDDETDSDESDLSSQQTKGFGGGRDDDSDSQSDTSRRKKSRAVRDSDGSEDQPTARERKRAAERHRSRDDDRKMHRSRNKDRERDRDRD